MNFLQALLVYLAGLVIIGSLMLFAVSRVINQVEVRRRKRGSQDSASKK